MTSYYKLFKFPKTENYIIAVLVILCLNIFVNYLKIDADYYIDSGQVETLFYIQENLPKNSTILVPDLKDRNYLYDLFNDYKFFLVDNRNKDPWVYDFIRGYLGSNNKRYAVIDISIMEAKQLSRFKNDQRFEVLYINSHDILFEYHLKIEW